MQHHRSAIAIGIELGIGWHPPGGGTGQVGRIIDHAEFQGGSCPQDLLGAGSILDTWQLNHDPLSPLLLHQRLGHPQFIDPVADDGDVLLQGVLLDLLELGLAHGSGYQVLTILLGVRQLQILVAVAQFGQTGLLLILSTEHHHDLVARTTHTGVTDVLFTQLGTEVLNQLLLRLAQRLVHVHFHQEVHAAAQVQTQFQRASPDGGQPGRGCRCQVQRHDKLFTQGLGD